MKKNTKIALSIFWLIILSGFIVWLVFQNRSQNLVVNNSNNVVSNNESGTYIKGCFYRIGKEVYCGSRKYTLPRVDMDSFQVMEHLVAKDKNHVYIINKIYPDFDPQTFHRYLKDGLNLYLLFADKNGIYNMGPDNELVSLPLDINTATSVDDFYIRDKDGIYFNDDSLRKVNGIDPLTFHILGGCASVEKSYAEYAADKDHVIVGTQILPGIDPNHFVEIARIRNADGEIPYSFFLWKDTNMKHIYVYCGTMIKEADYDTFEYVNGRAQDKNNYYDFNTGGGSYAVKPINTQLITISSPTTGSVLRIGQPYKIIWSGHFERGDEVFSINSYPIDSDTYGTIATVPFAQASCTGSGMGHWSDLSTCSYTWTPTQAIPSMSIQVLNNIDGNVGSSGVFSIGQ